MKLNYETMFLTALFISLTFWLIRLLIIHRKDINMNRILAIEKRKLNVKNIALSNALNTEQLLLREFHHRVTNNLQLIINFLELQEGNKTITEMTSRIFCINAFYNLMYKDELQEEIFINEYLTKLSDYIIGSSYFHDNKPIIQINKSDIKLNLQTLIPLGLIVNELITNTIKHVSSKTKTLKVTINVSKAEAHSYNLKYYDHGKGLIKISQTPKSHGIYIIKNMIKQLDAELITDHTNGLSFCIKFNKKH